MLQSWNPWQELEDIQRRLSRATEGRNEAVTGRNWAPATDIVEDEEGLYIYIDMPDVDDDSLDVSTEQNSLRIAATRHYKKSDTQTVHYEARPKGEFSRSFTIPNNFDLDKVEAKYNRGVLQVFIPRTETTKARKVEVSTE
ncbi:MAG: Hsp20/alpha crystallin family protein [Trueperaceae bacterium]|nr:Hsp20/alpha crystallin family protein [Trueperaceae bacterium]